MEILSYPVGLLIGLFPVSEEDVQVTSLAIERPSGKLYAGTLGRGVLVLAAQ